jgi:ribonuclease T2
VSSSSLLRLSLSYQQAAATAVSADPAAAAATATTTTSVSVLTAPDTDCPDAGAESHSGCEDPIKGGTPFDLWELARSWTPGFCASGGKRTCAKKECTLSTMVPALTLHGMWPSFSKPVALSSAVTATAVDDASALAHHRRALRDISLITNPAVANAGGACFWPQDCTQPGWWPNKAPWAYDASLLPAGPEYETLAPAWYSDG